MSKKNEIDLLFTISTSEIARDNALLDRIKEKFGITSERELGVFLEINKSVLAEVRTYGKQVEAGDVLTKPRLLTVPQRLRAFDHLGYAWTRDIVMLLVPEALRKDLVHSDNKRTKESDPEKPPQRARRAGAAQ